MLRQICLTAALSASALLAAPVHTATLGSQADALTSDAHAADFTGRVKNIRIKKRRVGSGFKISVNTEGSSSSSVSSANVTLRDATTGETLDTLFLNTPKRGALELGGYTDLTEPEVVKIELMASQVFEDGSTGAESVPTAISISLTTTELGGLFGEATSDDGWKMRVRVTPEGELKSTLRNTNPRWLGDGVEAATLHTSTDTSSLGFGDTRQRLTARTDVDLEKIGLILTETTLFDAEGNELDRSTRTSNMTANGDIPTFSSVDARETKAGEAKLVSWTASQGEEAALTVKLTDAETGEAVISEVDKTPVATQRSYYVGGLEFEPGESPENYIYLSLIDLLDENGDPFGEQMEVELRIPAAVENGVGSDYVRFGDGLGALSVLVDDEGYHLHLVLNGSDNGSVSAANIIFEEPYEGPAPLEIEKQVEFVAQFDKWVQKGSGDLPNTYTVATTLTSAEGQVLGTVNADGSGTARVAGNGKGTKKSNIRVSIQFPLL